MANIKKSAVCGRCGGETAQGTLKAGNQEATIVIAGEPDGFLGVIPYTTSQVGARVCRKCGMIEIYARNVRDLLRIDGDDGG
jgi:ribosomal protein L40E